jgi:hypothetical protein
MTMLRLCRVTRKVLCLALSLAIVFGAASASAEPDDASASGSLDLGDWIPSLGFSVGFLSDEADGGVESGGLRPSIDGHSYLLDQLLSGSFGIASPALPLPGEPRIFARGSLLGLLGPARILTEEGDPSEFAVPRPTPRDGATISVPAEVVAGQGSVVEAEIQPFAVAAGLGVSFKFELGERTLRIKPSFEYLREDIEVTGRVHHAEGERLVTGGPPENSPIGDTVDDSGLVLIMLDGVEQRTFDSIGPGLELELEVTRTGPLLVSIFAETAATRVLGDRDIEFRASDALGNAATFRFEKASWSYRAGLGVRIHLTGD